MIGEDGSVDHSIFSPRAPARQCMIFVVSPDRPNDKSLSRATRGSFCPPPLPHHPHDKDAMPLIPLQNEVTTSFISTLYAAWGGGGGGAGNRWRIVSSHKYQLHSDYFPLVSGWAKTKVFSSKCDEFWRFPVKNNFSDRTKQAGNNQRNSVDV